MWVVLSTVNYIVKTITKTHKQSIIYMKKAILVLIAGTFFVNTVLAQINKVDDVKKSLETTNKDTVAWNYGGFLNIGGNEGFLHNWAAGGELASISVNSIFSGHLDRLNHLDIWSNNLDLTYGLTYNYSTSFIPRKSDDRIDFTSKYGHRVDTNGNFYFTTLFNFKSQFTKGYDYSVPGWDTSSTSRFFSPAYFTLALGMEYREGSDVSFFLSPVAARLTLVDKEYTSRSKVGAFGVDYNKTSQVQLGAYFSGRYLFNISKAVIYKTRVDLYSNYLAKDTKDSVGHVVKKDNPGNVTVLFDNLLSWKISKFFNVTVGALFIYDNSIPYSKTYVNTAGATVTKDDPGKDLGWLQIKQVFSLGLGYKF